jgi:signal transduction histidine kinase
VLPEVAIFAGLRSRLTLWYSGVLAVALLLFGIGLYLGVQQMLFMGVKSDLADYARHSDIGFVCSPSQSPPPGYPGPPQQAEGVRKYSACYDQHGTLLSSYDANDQPPTAFLDHSLAVQALQTTGSDAENGAVTDVVDAGGTIGQVYRYARVVYSYNGQPVVLVVGEAIGQDVSALHVLLTLLLVGALVVLALAGVGGYFLANRALIPARLAFARQQQFIADASHELRTPLTLLRADAEVLLYDKERLGEEDAMLLENITTEADHMSTLLSSMLTLARLDAGKQHQEYDVVSLEELARAGARRVEAFAERSGVTLKVEASGAATVIGDKMLLEQALLVVLDNAIKYNKQGGRVTLRASASNGQAHLAV